MQSQLQFINSGNAGCHACETTDKVGGAIYKVGGAMDVLFGKTEFATGYVLLFMPTV